MHPPASPAPPRHSATFKPALPTVAGDRRGGPWASVTLRLVSRGRGPEGFPELTDPSPAPPPLVTPPTHPRGVGDGQRLTPPSSEAPKHSVRNRPGFSGTLRLAGWDPRSSEARALPREPFPSESSGPPHRLARCPELPWASQSRGTGTASPSPASPRAEAGCGRPLPAPRPGAAQPRAQRPRLRGGKALAPHRAAEPHPDRPAQAGFAFLTRERLWAQETPVSSHDSV